MLRLGTSTDLTAPTGRVVRLDEAGYVATVSALMGGRPESVESSQAPSGLRYPFTWVNEQDRFSTRADSYRIDDDDFGRVVDNAKLLATRFVEQLDRPDCMGDGAFEACHREVLAEAVAQLYGRPAQTEELDQLTSVRPASGDLQGRAILIEALQAVLSNAQFLFRSEIGRDTSAAVSALDDFELASALAFTLTGVPPDAALFAAARDGRLSDPEVYTAQVDRILESELYARRVVRFVKEYFQYASAAQMPRDIGFSDYYLTEEVPDGTRWQPSRFVVETDLFVETVVAENRNDRFLATLLTSPTAFVSEHTAFFYDREGGARDPERTELDPSVRRGILMQPAWLTAKSEPDHNSPIKRGLFVQESMLCGDVPALPIEGVPELDIRPHERPLRDALIEHRDIEGCAGCHNIMDPMGLPLENFDLYGRYRTREAGMPVDTTGAIVWSEGEAAINQALDTPHELVDALAASEHVAQCFLAHAYEFFMGRSLFSYDDAVIHEATRRYVDEGGSFDAAVRHFVTSSVFKERSQP